MDNAERNGLADRLVASVATLPESPTASYPLVLANLVAVVLIDLAPRLAGHLAPSGQMLASGIIQPKADAVIAALAAAGLEVVTRHDDGEWVSLLRERAA